MINQAFSHDELEIEALRYNVVVQESGYRTQLMSNVTWDEAIAYADDLHFEGFTEDEVFINEIA